MRARLLTLVLAFTLAAPAAAQHLGWGIKIGATLTDIFSEGGINEADKVVIGPMLDIRLPIIGFEADALYHNATFTPTFGSKQSSSGSSFQFPIVAKVHAPTPLLKPYVEGGVAFRAFLGGTAGLSSQSKSGFVLGGGLDFHVIVLHIAPELRYTHWGSGNSPLLQANQNQFEFLVGFSR